MIETIIVHRKGNNRNRLTVTDNRITLKLCNDVTEDQEVFFKRFSLMVAQRTRAIFYKTMRGVFSANGQSIEMQNTSKSQWSLYCFDELEPEGFAFDTIKSTEKTSRGTAFAGGISSATPPWKATGTHYPHGQHAMGHHGYGIPGWGEYGEDFVD